MEIGFIALLALWGLSRSGLSANRVYPVLINNPADLTTAGYIGEQGSINQPTYGKMKVGFEAPDSKYYYSTRPSKSGARKYCVYYVGAVEPRVIITVPAGYVGAGTEYNVSNWITQNMGEGYYVMVKGLKSGVRGGRPSNTGNLPSAQFNALMQRDIGISYVEYETGQRYIRHASKEDAIAQANVLIDSWDATWEPTDPTPKPEPTPDPTIPPTSPTLPPMEPVSPIPPTGGDDGVTPSNPQPINPVDPSPFNPQPVGGFVDSGLNGGGNSGLMGGY